MRRPIFATLSAAVLVALLAVPALAAHGGPPTVVVMQHVCKPEIQSEADFKAVEDAGAGGMAGGQGTLPGLVATVLACPTINLTKDTPTAGIHADPANFEYSVKGASGEDYTLSADGSFMPAKLCEADIDLDVDGDGDKDATTCLDVSMYGFAPVSEGKVTVTQTTPVAGTHFGTLRNTPASTDEMALVSAANGKIVLDTTKDTQVSSPPLPLDEYNDDVVVLHVYNFMDAAGQMPNASMTPSGQSSLPLVLLGFGALLAAAGAAAFASRRQRR